ncbi:MAG: hypothetical protein WCO71_11060 [Pseudomonadota bacterium]
MLPDLLCATPLGVTAWVIDQSALSDHCLSIMKFPAALIQVPLEDYPKYLIGTLSLEAMVLFPIMLRLKFGFREIITALLVVNLATHPVLCFLAPRVFGALGASYVIYLATSELLVIFVEGFLLRRFFGLSKWWAFIASVTTNGFSWTAGSVLLLLTAGGN